MPSLNAGTNYHLHTGNLQRSSGRILNLTEQSLYFGGGAVAIAAGTVEIPAVNIFGTLTEAWFEPLAAHQRVIGTSFTALATANEILLDVALLHLELLANQAILEAQRLTESQVHDLAVTVNDFAVAGERRTADANRAQAEWKLHRAAVQRAEEAVAVTAARLANRLNLDPTIRLRPAGGPLVPINLIALDTPTRDLIAVCPSATARPGRAVRRGRAGGGPVPRGAGTPVASHGLAGLQRRRLRRRQQRRAADPGPFRRAIRLRRRVFWTLMNLGAGNLSLQNRRYARRRRGGSPARADDQPGASRNHVGPCRGAGRARSDRDRPERAGLRGERAPRGRASAAAEPGPAHRGAQQPEPRGRGPRERDQRPCSATTRPSSASSWPWARLPRCSSRLATTSPLPL